MNDIVGRHGQVKNRGVVRHALTSVLREEAPTENTGGESSALYRLWAAEEELYNSGESLTSYFVVNGTHPANTDEARLGNSLSQRTCVEPSHDISDIVRCLEAPILTWKSEN